jgi:hypothetical protein
MCIPVGNSTNKHLGLEDDASYSRFICTGGTISSLLPDKNNIGSEICGKYTHVWVMGTDQFLLNCKITNWILLPKFVGKRTFLMMSIVFQGERTRKFRIRRPWLPVPPINHFRTGIITPAISNIEVNVFSKINAATYTSFLLKLSLIFLHDPLKHTLSLSWSERRYLHIIYT